LPLAELSPNRLREVQEAMIAAGLTRQTVNGRVGKIRQFASWCVGRELCDESIARALEHVEPVKPRPGVKEGPGRRPVTWATVEATLPHLPEMLRALVKVLWLTGARVGEVRRLTTGMIDRSGDVWIADLRRHKTAWAGKGRVVLFGPEAQEALGPWLRPGDPDAVIFSPKRLEGRPAKNRGRRPPGEVYHRVSLPQAIRRACAAAFPHPTLAAIKPRKRTREQRAELKSWGRAHAWTLAQLRHSRATELRERFGIETAAMVLGHSRPTTTVGYSREAIAPAVEAIRRVG
jgi:integrase